MAVGKCDIVSESAVENAMTKKMAQEGREMEGHDARWKVNGMPLRREAS
jgi:hypothetical protein